MVAVGAVEDKSVLNGGYHCPARMFEWGMVAKIIEDIHLSRA
jgi:hypothetical protein